MSGLSQDRLENLLAHCKESAASVTEEIAASLGAEGLSIEVGDPQAGFAELQGTEAETTALAIVRNIGNLFTFFYLDPGPIRPDWWGDSMSGQEQLVGISSALAKLISSEEPAEAPDLMWEKTLADAADLHDFPDDVTVIPLDLVSGEKKGHAFLIAVETESAEQPDEQTPEPEAEVSEAETPEVQTPEAEAPEVETETETDQDEEAVEQPSEQTPEPAAEAPEAEAPTAETEAETDQGEEAVESEPEVTPTVSGPVPEPAETAPAQAAPAPAAATSTSTAIASFDHLPIYARTLLHVKVPVIVTLATKKESVNDILNLSPGTILQFKKSCEDPLDLSVGNRPVAKGEAVKVGEKFGLRIMSMLLPSDRHITLKSKSDSTSA